MLVAAFNTFLLRQTSPILANPVEDINSSNYVKALQNLKTGISSNSSEDNVDTADARNEKQEGSGAAEMTAARNTPAEIKINKGMTSEEIADLLYEKGIIENPRDFINLAVELRVTKQFRYGIKQIPHGSSLQNIIEILTKIE
jgi:predicted transcriptional regulator YheO